MSFSIKQLICALILPCFALVRVAGSQPVQPEAIQLQGVPVDLSAQHYDRQIPYQNIRTALFADWIPDGGILVATRFDETYQLHSVQQPMGARHQETFYPEPITRASFSPMGNPDQFLFAMDEAGSEATHLFLHDRLSGQSTQLTNEGISRYPLWANESSLVAFSTTKRNGRDWDIHILNADHPTSDSLAVVTDSGLWYPADWDANDSRLLVGKYISASKGELYVVDMANGSREKINPEAEGEISYGAAVFARRGDGVFFVCDEDGEFKSLYYYDLKHHAKQRIDQDISWDISELAISPDGSSLAYTANVDGLSQLFLVDTQTLEQRQVDLPNGIVSRIKFHPSQPRLALTLYRPTSPGDVYVLNTQTNELTRWTQSEVGGLPEETFVDVELIHYRTFDLLPDGTPRMIPAFVYKPKGEGPWPVYISIHGGPESQARPYFSSRFQYYVNELGFAVIQPNVRGSRGYGKSYLKLDNAEKREESVQDIGALLDWLGHHEEYDANRVAVGGGSYGGYMVLASLARFPEQIKAGICVVGISNFVTFLENTSEYRRDLRRVEYGDERDPEMRAHLEKISPTNLVDLMNSPVLIVHGANDPRVPASEAEQIVEALDEREVPVWYMLAENEGHGLARRENRDYYGFLAAEFLDRFVVQAPSTTTP